MEPSNTSNHKLPQVDQPLGEPSTQNGPTNMGAQPLAGGMIPGQQAQQISPITPQMMQQQSAISMAMGGGLQAADVDLIEKAWVEKAKAIVQGTYGNPFLQSQELSKMKAEYIKKRYNKDIKVAE